MPFHCIVIADGSRDIDVGTEVEFDLISKLGRYEADHVVSDMNERASASSTSSARFARARWSPTATSPRTPATRSGRASSGTSWRRPTRTLPWWRVVNSVGRLVPGHEREQSAQLRVEGVKVTRRQGPPGTLRAILLTRYRRADEAGPPRRCGSRQCSPDQRRLSPRRTGGDDALSVHEPDDAPTSRSSRMSRSVANVCDRRRSVGEDDRRRAADMGDVEDQPYDVSGLRRWTAD